MMQLRILSGLYRKLADTSQIDRELRRTESAVDKDVAIVITHFLSIVFREPLQDLLIMIHGAAATALQPVPRKCTHLVFFVKQPPHDGLER